MDIKQKFERMCDLILVEKNTLSFPYIDLKNNDDFIYWSEDEDYPILKEKMDNLIVLVNNDLSLIQKDISEELWDLI